VGDEAPVDWRYMSPSPERDFLQSLPLDLRSLHFFMDRGCCLFTPESSELLFPPPLCRAESRSDPLCPIERCLLLFLCPATSFFRVVLTATVVFLGYSSLFLNSFSSLDTVPDRPRERRFLPATVISPGTVIFSVTFLLSEPLCLFFLYVCPLVSS